MIQVNLYSFVAIDFTCELPSFSSHYIPHNECTGEQNWTHRKLMYNIASPELSGRNELSELMSSKTHPSPSSPSPVTSSSAGLRRQITVLKTHQCCNFWCSVTINHQGWTLNFEHGRPVMEHQGVLYQVDYDTLVSISQQCHITPNLINTIHENFQLQLFFMVNGGKDRE